MPVSLYYWVQNVCTKICVENTQIGSTCQPNSGEHTGSSKGRNEDQECNQAYRKSYRGTRKLFPNSNYLKYNLTRLLNQKM